MKTPKLILSIVIILSSMAVSNSDSYGMNYNLNTNSVQIYNQDKDPNSHLFKLYNSKRTEFDNTTVIKFKLGEDANVLLTVCDSEGKIMETLIDDLMYAGIYNVNYKTADRIISGELTYILEVRGVSGIKNVFAVK